MREEEIRELEPKYTGNTRHLTEGEAEEIMHDPGNKELPEEGAVEPDDILPAAFLLNRDMSDGDNRL